MAFQLMRIKKIMVSSDKISSEKFPFKQLGDVLQHSKIICIVGYEFSWQSRHAPHFIDIRSGVWSTDSEKSKINPFTSVDHYCLVMNWFNCRRNIITTSNKLYKNSEMQSLKVTDFFQSLKILQSDLNLTIATQAEDGLMSLNDIENAYELYGNVLYSICFDNGHKHSYWPINEKITQLITCNKCGSTVFPNVEMFGWNKQAAPRVELLEKIEMANALLLIGADRNIAPFNDVDNNGIAQLPIIELVEDCITFNINKSAYKATFYEIEKHIRHLTGKSEEKNPKIIFNYQSSMDYLTQLHKIYGE